MRDDAVILGDEVTREDLAAFVNELGGRWTTSDDPPGYQYGVIERVEALLIVDITRFNEFYDYDAEEIESVRARLGMEPRLQIGIRIRRNDESSALAEDIEQRILARWGGCVEKEE